MAMPFAIILVLYVIPCKLLCDFTKFTILYIYTFTYIHHFMTNKSVSVMTFLYVIKYLSVCVWYVKMGSLSNDLSAFLKYSTL